MLKSAYELAMEKTGGAAKALSGEKKKEIGELNSKYAAQIAEREISVNERVAGAMAAGEFETADELRRLWAEEKARIEEKRDREKEKIRG